MFEKERGRIAWDMAEHHVIVEIVHATDAILATVQHGRRWPWPQRSVAEDEIRRAIRQMVSELKSA
jgi:hypothetical protein